MIPTLNEASVLPLALGAIPPRASLEVIVVDGGSTDDTLAVAQSWGVKAVAAAPGRARQMNQGAALASGDILLFLHADTRLPPHFAQLVGHTLARPGVVAGAFNLAIDGPGLGLRLVEAGVWLRSHLAQLPYGDQAIFLLASQFQAIGGFPELPIMEDFELVRRLQRRGQVAISAAAVHTSSRRWQTLGIGRTTLVNQAMVIGYSLGVSPDRLARWYRTQGRKDHRP